MVIAGGDDEIAVAGSICLEGRYLRMTRAERLRYLTERHIGGQGGLEHRNLAVKHCNIDLDGTPALRPLLNGSDNTDGQIQPRSQITDRYADPGGRAIKLPGHAHELPISCTTMS